MREIKFRFYGVFDNEEPQMLYGDVFAFSEYGVINDHLNSVENTMQYTGFKDKNGKEIYESDLVVYSLSHDSSQREINAQVEWHNHAWRLNKIWLLTEIRTIKVIGNIYENPEFVSNSNSN